jgi:hypothetical protein
MVSKKKKNEILSMAIKAASYGSKPTNELQILRYINSDILFADKTETYPIVPVIKFIEHSRWMDGISPRWCDSTYPASFNAGEVLKWASRLMSASQSLDMPRLVFDSIYRLLPSCCIVRLVSVFFRNWSHSFLSLTSRVHSHELPRC